MLNEDEIIWLIKDEPRLLRQDGKTLNTWRLIFGESIIPQFDIKYVEAITSSGELLTLYTIENGVGYDDDGNPCDLIDIAKILDIDVSIYYEQKYLSNINIIEDVIYYSPESRFVTLTYLLNTHINPIYINSLPLFDHTKIKYNFNGKLVIGVDNYHKILMPINYMNCNLIPDNNGMVKIAYDIEIPYTMFYNKNVNDILNKVIPCVPLIDYSLIVSLDQ